MKKLFLILAGTVLLAGTAAAQQYEKHIFGVRAGLNIANVSIDGIKPEAKAGFHIGGSWQYLLTENHLLYLESGLSITQKGFKLDKASTKCNLFYAQVPVLVTYKFAVADEVRIMPVGGFYYALGLGGKLKMKGEDGTEKADMFGEDGFFKRSDFGMRFGGAVEWKRYTFGVGYEFSLMNVGSDSSDTHNRNFYFSVGYNF